MFRFIFADLRRNRIGAAILVVLVALATGLGVAVTLQERALRLGSARAASPFDLLIGAAGSETQLVLSSVFLRASPLPLVSGSVLAALRADPRVEAAIPIGLGDSVGAYPIIGTTPEAIAMVGGMKEGSEFRQLDEAVAGAAVTRPIGFAFHSFHGEAGAPGEVHAETQYHITGRLRSTGTPWDRAILVPIQSIWAIHAEHGHDEDTQEEEIASLTGPLNEAAITSGDNPGIPAIAVKPKSIADAYNLRQQYRHGETMAVFPGEVLTRLYGTLGDARLILSAVAVAAQALVGAAILMAIAIHMLQRRRQIGALRALGAPRMVIVAMIGLEVFAVLALGLLLGFAVGYGAASALSRHFAQVSGISMPVIFQEADIWKLGIFVAVAALAALLPAAAAFRHTPAQALRS